MVLGPERLGSTSTRFNMSVPQCPHPLNRDKYIITSYRCEDDMRLKENVHGAFHMLHQHRYPLLMGLEQSAKALERQSPKALFQFAFCAYLEKGEEHIFCNNSREILS